jgi:hypothetical protein
LAAPQHRWQKWWPMQLYNTFLSLSANNIEQQRKIFAAAFVLNLTKKIIVNAKITECEMTNKKNTDSLLFP